MHNTPGNSKVRLEEIKTWLPEASGLLAWGQRTCCAWPLCVLTEGNREPDGQDREGGT